MSGIYIHIPYCIKACNYCDFHFSASLKYKEQMVECICSEAELHNKYLNRHTVNTIYFGGGTPSVLLLSEINQILSVIYRNFTIDNNIELTFEVNPDDVTPEYIKGLQKMGINRLSIGVQSFFDNDLKWMNRRHNAVDAIKSIKICQDAGLENINIDLIYGLPYSSLQNWEMNLKKFYSLDIPHLSAYHLTIEPKTILGVLKKKGKIADIEEEISLEQYQLLLEFMEKWDYQNYEISNFSRSGYYSKHNLNYWNQGVYLGLGPSAHSFNGNSRQWNISVNQQYIQKITNKEEWYEKENLTLSDSLNDYLLTRLRTMWGINLNEIKKQFGDLLFSYVEKEIHHYIGNGLLEYDGSSARLTNKGKFVANTVISGLMYVD